MPRIATNIVDVYVFRRAAQIEFLTLLRAPRSRLGQTWQSVHGRIEAGESAWQAALRELGEETALKPLGFWQLEFVNAFYVARDDTLQLCPCFAAEAAPAADIRLSHEHTAFRWLPYPQILEALLWPGQRQAVCEVMEQIVRPGPAEPFLRIPLPDESHRPQPTRDRG